MKSINGMQTGQLISVLSHFFIIECRRSNRNENIISLYSICDLYFSWHHRHARLSLYVRPGTIVRSWRSTTRGRSRLEATTSFVIIRRARHSTKLSLHRRRPSLSGFSSSCLERTARTRHIVAVVTRLQTAFEDSPLLQEFLHCRITINWTIVTVAPALHVVNFLYIPWRSS